MDKHIKVSIVMPVYNEERYITDCINSLFEQTFPFDSMEWIFVDGGSTDRTVDILNTYKEKYPRLIKVRNNPYKTVPYAMNIGIQESIGEFIIRLDAHASYDNNYIARCIHYLELTGADNVGGIVETKSRGTIGEAIAKMLSSKFGVGNSQFRINGKSAYVDTVPFGAFRRSVFDKIGLYNERLTRNQDNELNYRIRKHGGKIYLSNEIKLSYYCRDSVAGIAKMAFQNGKWNVYTMKMCPGSMRVRHFVPFLFLFSLMVLIPSSFCLPIFRYLLIAESLLYFFLDLCFSAKIAKNLKEVGLLLMLFPLFHLSYGLGSLIGILKRQ